MKKVKKIPNCCSYNSPGFTYSQPFQTDAQMVLDLKLSYEHPPKGAFFPLTVLSAFIRSREFFPAGVKDILYIFVGHDGELSDVAVFPVAYLPDLVGDYIEL